MSVVNPKNGADLMNPAWGSMPLKYLLASMGSGGTPSTDDETQWGVNGEGVPWVAIADMSQTRHVASTSKTVSAKGVAEKRLAIWPAGTLLMSMYASLGHVARLGVPAATNQAILALQPRSDVDIGFLEYWLTGVQPLLKANSNSNTQDNLNAEKVANLPATKPPLDLQRRIAAFLDDETARIDELVQEQERLVALLDEELEARLLRLVLGLDPYTASWQPTDWLPTTPEGWRRVALRHVSGVRCDGPFGSSLRSEHYTQAGARVVRLQNIRARRFDNSDAVYIDEAYAASLRHHAVEPGDLLVAGLGDDTNPVGRACVAPPWIGQAIVKADCFRIRLNSATTHPPFIAAQLSSTAPIHAPMLANGSTRSRIPLGKMAGRSLLLPPIETQRQITGEIDRIDDHAEKLKGAAQSATLLLAERRSALITAAVTGQIDVSAWTPPDDWLSPEAA